MRFHIDNKEKHHESSPAVSAAILILGPRLDGSKGNRMKSLYNNHDPNWEAWFENAAEDVSGFERALTELENAGEDADIGQQLTTGLNHRSRSIQALPIFPDDLPPPGCLPCREKLQSRLEAAETRLIRVLEERFASIWPLFLPEGDMHRQTDALEHRLKKLIKAFQDWMLCHDETDALDESLWDMAQDVLPMYAAIYRTAEDPPETLARTDAFQKWRLRFRARDRRFQSGFGYLQPAARIFEDLRHREYFADCWWLTRPPSLDDVLEAQPDHSLDSALTDLAKAPPEDRPVFSGLESFCPDSGLVIDYALDELTGPKHLEVQNHVRSCAHCLNLVLDLRSAHQESSQDSRRPVDWTQYAAAFPERKRPAAESEWRHIPAAAFFQNMKNRFPDILNWPESIPAMWHSVLDVLMNTPFNQQALPLMAADHSGETIVAKWVTVDGGTIQTITPKTVFIHHLTESDNIIEISGELPSTCETISDIDIYFGLTGPDGMVRLLKTVGWERRNMFFAGTLQKLPSDKLEGGIRIVVINQG